MEARKGNPLHAVPEAFTGLLGFSRAAEGRGVPTELLTLLLLRASQLNGCSVCTDMHSKELRKAGETDERLFSVAAWRDTPYFTDAERAALAFTEALTRIADRPGGVPDEVYDEAARHFDDDGLNALIITIAAINAWNRISVATRQVAGAWPADRAS